MKKQKEESRKARQAEKRQRRQMRTSEASTVVADAGGDVDSPVVGGTEGAKPEN
jgi:hypothetical protein